MKKPLTPEEIIARQKKKDAITEKVAIAFVFAGVFYFFVKLVFL